MENLINSGKLLLEESNFAKPKMRIWQIQCERTLAGLYDKEIAEEFSRMIDGGAVIRPGMNLYVGIYRPRIQNAITFLESLLETDLPQPATIECSGAKNPKYVAMRFGHRPYPD